jgi:hypothetical protein
MELLLEIQRQLLGYLDVNSNYSITNRSNYEICENRKTNVFKLVFINNLKNSLYAKFPRAPELANYRMYANTETYNELFELALKYVENTSNLEIYEIPPEIMSGLFFLCRWSSFDLTNSNDVVTFYDELSLIVDGV